MNDPAGPAPDRRQVFEAAAAVLRANDTGTMVTAAPRLYPHMWSWDAAFVAIGLARLSISRACLEMDTLLGAQWTNGMVPHIVFSPGAASYFPGPDRWGATMGDSRAAAAPDDVHTSGICQPPVHAIAIRRIGRVATANGGRDAEMFSEFIARRFDDLVAWHRWLASARDPDGTGLLEIIHGWESGMDNSPRWDPVYARVSVGAELPPYNRRDNTIVTDGTQRPTTDEYDRYLWLIEQMKSVNFDDEAMRAVVSFRCTDVAMSAILAVASDELADLGTEMGRPGHVIDELRTIARRFRTGVCGAMDAELGLTLDTDRLTGEIIRCETVAGFSPLLCGGLDEAIEREMLERFTGPDWCGYDGFRYALPPSARPDSPGWHPRTYWRGPQWPFWNWLMSWSLARLGHHDVAARLRAEGIRQVSDLEFGEYYEPFTGEPLGSRRQSWSAAAALDWLAAPEG